MFPKRFTPLFRTNVSTFVLWMSVSWACVPCWGQEFEGFTEPSELIHVASSETGIVSEILVHEGETVEAGQALAKLDGDLQTMQLEIARENAHARGTLQAAEAEHAHRTERMNKLVKLHSDGHARQEEVKRANADLDIAKANLLAAQEELARRQLELQRSQMQLMRRTIVSPSNGVVTKISKRVGEFIAASSPEVLILVQLDSLIANFNMVYADAKQLQVGEDVSIHFLSDPKPIEGTVIFISPINDAESGTTRVKVRIPNREFEHRSGQRCRMILQKSTHPTSSRK